MSPLKQEEVKGHSPAAAPVHHGRPQARKAVTVDDIIVIVFALIGFLGAGVLYFLNAAPIITSVFLATGVSSLVYRFLGGIQGANFVWGALKLTGSMAALVGLAFAINYYLQAQTRVPAAGQYEWQWAGDGWRGYINIAADGKAEIAMKKFMSCNGVLTEKEITRANGPGTAKESADGKKLEVSFPVTFIDYDSNCNGKDSVPSVVSGTLEKTQGFAGRVEYVNKWAKSRGDMILVKYYSH